MYFYGNEATRLPSSYPSACHCFVIHARDAASDALAELAATELSATGNPRQRPEFWVEHLRFLLGYLLVSLEETDSVPQRTAGQGVL